mmetsp:Transcript_4339/g.8549  ORF Transcript_4339/g.8549 Transcript_4339/m.8549 type:complete len:105 (+) Transcript_4339:23-337(+)
MDESHVAGVTAVLRTLQRLCRTDDVKERDTCRREMYERVMTEEIARGNEPEYIDWRLKKADQLKNCYEECRLNGKNEVKSCNTTCLNSLVREMWQRTNVLEGLH